MTVIANMRAGGELKRKIRKLLHVFFQKLRQDDSLPLVS